MTALAAVDWELEADVAVITLASPPANALDETLGAELTAAVAEIESTSAKAVVLRSGIPGCFATGADVRGMALVDRDGFVAHLAGLREALEGVASSVLVSIAAIDGQALGSGLELALACTMRVAGRSSRLGLPQVKLGLLPAGGGTQRLPRLIGRAHALDLLISGRAVDAEEARSIGLVDRLCEQGGAERASLALAESVATLSGPALAAVTRCVDVAESLPFAEGMAVEAQEILQLLYETND